MSVDSCNAAFWPDVPSDFTSQQGLTVCSPLCSLIPNGDEPIRGKAPGYIEITAIIQVAPLATVDGSGGSDRRAPALAKFQTVRDAQLLFSAAVFSRRPPSTVNEQLISSKPH